MNVLNAGILTAGLAAIAIPIIIHFLMRRRRQPVLWGAMRFVLEAYRQTRRRLLLERWLLLATRCLLLAAIAFALGRPLISGAATTASGGRTLYLLIDDSLTSSVTTGGKTALARHQADALALLDALADGDRVGLITLSRPAKGVIIPPSLDLRAVRAVITDLQSTDARADTAGAMRELESQLSAATDTGLPKAAFVGVLSGFLEGSADLQAALPKLPPGTRLLATTPTAAVASVGVTSATPQRQVLVAGDSGGAQTVRVTLHRTATSPAAATTPIRLRLGPAERPSESVQVGIGEVAWRPGEREATVTLALDASARPPSGPAVVTVEVDDTALGRDNTFRLPIESRPTLRVGVIAGAGERTDRAPDNPAALSPAQWLGLALRPSDQTPVDITPVEPGGLDNARLAALDALIILAPQRLDADAWTRVMQFARGGATSASTGGLVFITPPADLTVHTWTDAMVQGLGLTWSLPRQARVLTPSDPKVAGPRLTTRSSLAPSDPADLLGAIRGELSELVAPIQFTRVLAPTVEALAGATDTATLLSLDDGTPIVIALRPASRSGTANTTASRGSIVWLSSALDLSWSDVPAKPLMVPLIQELVRQGVSKARPAWIGLAGDDLRVPAQAAELRPIGEGTAIALARAGAAETTVDRAGLWKAIDATGSTRAIVAINADPAAGLTGSQEPQAVRTWLTSTLMPTDAMAFQWLASSAPGPTSAEAVTAANIMTSTSSGTPSSSLWLAPALVLALIELLLARRASHGVLSQSPLTTTASTIMTGVARA